ncbi:MAG TPA: hypothetical protein VLU73_12710 [Methylococcaceae bacterium]|nr:hypothetical protein [Methylococcaceae bacterium]
MTIRNPGLPPVFRISAANDAAEEDNFFSEVRAMLLGPLSNTGLTAIQRGLNRVDQASDQIAKASMSPDVEGRPTDLIKPIVELSKADLETQAAVKLLQAEDETIERLLDVKA